jgi:hypothetical protein
MIMPLQAMLGIHIQVTKPFLDHCLKGLEIENMHTNPSGILQQISSISMPSLLIINRLHEVNNKWLICKRYPLNWPSSSK